MTKSPAEDIATDTDVKADFGATTNGWDEWESQPCAPMMKDSTPGQTRDDGPFLTEQTPAQGNVPCDDWLLGNAYSGGSGNAQRQINGEVWTGPNLQRF